MRAIERERPWAHRYRNFDFWYMRCRRGKRNSVLTTASPASRALEWQHGTVTGGWLSGYHAQGETETADVERMRRLAHCEPDPWLRSLPLHFTASALVVHPESRRVLLRWHQRQRMWLQVGGHADPGESDPLRIALREAREET